MNIRVSANSQLNACLFAERLVPYLGDKMAKTPRLAAVCSPEGAAALTSPLVRFIPIEEWRLQDAQNIIQSLCHDGVNVLILSEGYLKGDSDITEDLQLFENLCSELCMNIIEVEEHGENVIQSFDPEPEWHDAALESILGIMFDEYKEESLCMPWGGVPYFIIEPEFDKASKSVRLLAGFQPWSYEHLPDEYVPERYLFTHWTPVEHMTHSKKMGPVPFKCC